MSSIIVEPLEDVRISVDGAERSHDDSVHSDPLVEAGQDSINQDMVNANQDGGEEDEVEGVAGNDDEDNDDDDDLTVILLEQGADSAYIDQGTTTGGWIEQESPEMEERRRNVLLRELQRVQRASFIHFLILCLIPTSLLFIVIGTVIAEDEECQSAATTCTREARTFMNAFTTRCVCDAITIPREHQEP